MGSYEKHKPKTPPYPRRSRRKYLRRWVSKKCRAGQDNWFTLKTQSIKILTSPPALHFSTALPIAANPPQFSHLFLSFSPNTQQSSIHRIKTNPLLWVALPPNIALTFRSRDYLKSSQRNWRKNWTLVGKEKVIEENILNPIYNRRPRYLKHLEFL